MSRPHGLGCLGITLLGGCLLACSPAAPVESVAPTTEAAVVDTSAITLRYPATPFRLREKLSMKMEMRGPGAGSLDIDVVGTLDSDAHGSDAAKLRVDTQIEAVNRYVLSGALEPELPADQPKPDFAALLVGAKSHAIVDIRGEDDETATARLAENVEKQQRLERLTAESGGKPSAELIAESLGLASVLSLPQLPEQTLAVGETIDVPPKTEDRPLGGRTLPVEVKRRYAVTGVDDSAGQVMTLEFSIEGHGADELAGPSGPMAMTYDERTKGTLRFDLASSLPVSIAVTQTSTIVSGEMNFEQTLQLDASFEPIS